VDTTITEAYMTQIGSQEGKGQNGGDMGKSVTLEDIVKYYLISLALPVKSQ
jgi:hypothetical protein